MLPKSKAEHTLFVASRKGLAFEMSARNSSDVIGSDHAKHPDQAITKLRSFLGQPLKNESPTL